MSNKSMLRNKDVILNKQEITKLEQASYFFHLFSERVHSVFWARDVTCNKQLFLSPSYEKVWGRSCESLYKNPDSWLDTLHPEDREQACNEARFRMLSEKGPNTQYENRYRIITPKNEVRWIKDTSFPLYNDQNKFIGFAGIAEDITQEVEHEKELREAKQRAEKANQTKTDFLAMISHEIRTPLNAILGMAQILQMKGLSLELQEYVQTIHSSGNSLLALVNDILDFARLDAGKLTFNCEPFDLKQLFNDIVQSMQYQVSEKEVSLFIEYEGIVPHLVVGDMNRVRQVLVNLLTNAIKFTERGSIKVLVQCLKQAADNALIQVRVIDTGIGIPQDQLESVFDKFCQVESSYQRKYQGIGLGLTIAKELIRVMQGDISVKSEYGKGSEFKFTIQLKLQNLYPDQQAASGDQIDFNSSEASLYSRLSILLVEDNLINQKVAKIMLEHFGCEVDIVDNGQDVLEDIDRLLQYDLIFMDLGLPDMSGFEVTKRLREKPLLKDMPIIALTAHVLEHERTLATEAGITEILAKPINYAQLEALLKNKSAKLRR